jgi:hypothetical protein
VPEIVAPQEPQEARLNLARRCGADSPSSSNCPHGQLPNRSCSRVRAADRHGDVPVHGRAIVDTTPPVLTLPRDFTALATPALGGGTKVPLDYSASAVDKVDGPVPVTCSPPSPVAPVKIPANWHILLSGRTPRSGRPHKRLFMRPETAQKPGQHQSRVTRSSRFDRRRDRPRTRACDHTSGRRSTCHGPSLSHREQQRQGRVEIGNRSRAHVGPGCQSGRRHQPPWPETTPWWFASKTRRVSR